MGKWNFPFTISQVADILQLKNRHKKQNGDIDVDCPFCNAKSKMNLSAAKNSFRCVVCNESGGQIILYARIHGIDNRQAYREIVELLGCNENNAASYKAQQASIPTIKEPPRADRETIHQTYGMMLSCLRLATIHHEQLTERGLPIDDIVKFGYKSVPAFGLQKLCAELIGSGCSLEGVPGFYKGNDGTWTVKLTAPGLLIPVCGIDGKIEAMQIRLNNPLNDRKYIWLSSKGLDGGATSGSPLHFVGDPTAKKIFITEGPLKGGVAHSLTRHTFICLPGVNSVGKLDSLLKTLKANGTEIIYEAFDIDKYTNEHVKKAAQRLREMAKELCFKVYSTTWENKDLKGVDDYYLARRRERQKGVYTVDVKSA